MTEVVSNWVVAPGANLIGISRLRHVAGERMEFACSGKVILHVVLEGHYGVTDPLRKTIIGPGDVYFVQRRIEETETGEHLPISPDPVVEAMSASATILCAGFSASTTALHTTVRALPATLHVTADQTWTERQIGSTLALLKEEFKDETCGKELLSNHLFEALFLYVIRYWYSRFPETSCLLNAFGDPYLARAIERVHEAPGHAWTLDELASIAGLSRAAFARRFKHSVGDTPIGYVTRWRMNMAAQMLDQAADIRHICERVGYVSEFAFSRAFSRHHGTSPTGYRNRLKPAA